MTIKRELRCKLTPEEANTKTANMLALMEDITKLESEKKAKAKMYADLIKEKKKRRDEYASDVRTGTERRQVECEEIADYRTNRVETKRLDTGEIIDTRAMTAKERQTELKVGDAKKKPSAPSRRAKPKAKPKNGKAKS